MHTSARRAPTRLPHDDPARGGNGGTSWHPWRRRVGSGAPRARRRRTARHLRSPGLVGEQGRARLGGRRGGAWRSRGRDAPQHPRALLRLERDRAPGRSRRSHQLPGGRPRGLVRRQRLGSERPDLRRRDRCRTGARRVPRLAGCLAHRRPGAVAGSQRSSDGRVPRRLGGDDELHVGNDRSTKGDRAPAPSARGSRIHPTRSRTSGDSRRTTYTCSAVPRITQPRVPTPRCTSARAPWLSSWIDSQRTRAST